MTVASQSRSIDDLIGKATAALDAKRYVEADREALKALHLAREDNDFQRMISVLPTLIEARQQRLSQALDAGTVTIVDTPFDENLEHRPGCYLVQPPLVGADARRLRAAAHARDVPVAVVCREPVIRIGLCPLVAISTGVTIRTKIGPPADLEQPDLEWYLDAVDALGEAALEGLDPQQQVERRLDELLARIDAVPDYEPLHQCLIDAAHEALAANTGEADGGSDRSS